jgi:tryptophanyl-tRNA synthetase
VSNLVLLTALCEGTAPERVAEEVGSGGAAALKRRATAAVNDHLRPIRARRAELIADRGYLREVVAAGSERARPIADATLDAVSTAMHTTY